LRRASRGQQTSPSRPSVNRECQSLKLVFKSARILSRSLYSDCVLRVHSKRQEGSRPCRADLRSTVSDKDGAVCCPGFSIPLWCQCLRWARGGSWWQVPCL
jgi:hypothetical protein